MLELSDISVTVNDADLLAGISVKFPLGHFGAILGPSGCGKTTLLKFIAGIASGEEDGALVWKDRNLADQDFSPSEIAYVPQFSTVQDELTVRECVYFAIRLRVRGKDCPSFDNAVNAILAEVSMTDFQDRRVKVLSGGQRRRLALAMELTSNPDILLCDEVTSGLDPQSEDDIVRLLHGLSRKNDRLILTVTHSLAHISLYDSVTVLHKGKLAYSGPPTLMNHYFRIENSDELYTRLDQRSSEEWSASWKKHRLSLIEAAREELSVELMEEEKFAPPEEKINEPVVVNPPPVPTISKKTLISNSVRIVHEDELAYEGPEELLCTYFSINHRDELAERLSERTPEEWGNSWLKHKDELAEAAASLSDPTPLPPALPIATNPLQEYSGPRDVPNAFVQTIVLFIRRLVIFSRRRDQVLLQCGLIFGFPILVSVFAWNGLPAVKNLSMGLDLNVLQQLNEARDFLLQSSKIGSLVSGIVMFQVILLTLMGANNSGREIAAERPIFEKEKLSGLSPLAYIASKGAFLCLLVLPQSLWMGWFVHRICGFPGDLASQLFLLVLVNAAMTSVCLGVSSLMRTAEQASLAAIYLVGFQLPLSGAVLALPTLIGSAVRPFISAYWCWSGLLQTLKDERYYDIVLSVVQSPLSPSPLCIWVLFAHIAAGLVITWIGCENRQID